GAARRRYPAPALAPTPGSLEGGGHERAIGSTGERELASALVGRIGLAQVQSRVAERPRKLQLGISSMGGSRVHARGTTSSPSRPTPRRSAAEPQLMARAAICKASS